VTSDQTKLDHNEKEEKTMVAAIFIALVALSLALGGLVLLIWWLWKLWGQREEKAVVPAIEIKAEVPFGEIEAGVVEIEVETAEPAQDAPAGAVEVKDGDADVETETAVEETVDQVEQPAVQVTPDDLTRIEGIGPKISTVLRTSGISTFAQLADCDPEQLRDILEASDPRLLRIADPTSWPEQAKFAADGDWEGLQELMGELKAGRRK
jgi:predicted flap endonuclease-1-like 5' DNA nuclease